MKLLSQTHAKKFSRVAAGTLIGLVSLTSNLGLIKSALAQETSRSHLPTTATLTGNNGGVIAMNNDDKDNCKKFIEELQKIQTNEENKKDIDKVRAVVDSKDALGKIKEDMETQNAFKRISNKQIEAIRKFFGNPVDITKFQVCIEQFTNFELVENFQTAIDNIKKDAVKPKNDNSNIVPLGPDNVLAFIRYPRFASLAIDSNIDRDTWVKLEHILVEGFAITVSVLGDNDPNKDGIQVTQKTNDDIKKIREKYDKFKPMDGETNAGMKDRREKLADELMKNLLQTAIAIAQEYATGKTVIEVKVKQADNVNMHRLDNTSD